MKVRYVAVIVGLAVAYPVSAWYFGQRVERTLDDQYKKLADYPYVKLVDRKMERGIFSSTETATFELSLPRPAAAKQMSEGAASAQTIRFSSRSVYKHGPLPGLMRFGSASAHTELKFDNQSPLLAKLYGDKAPLTIDTILGFSGAGHQDIRSPAVDAVLDDQTHVSWGELQVANDFQPDMAAYKLSGGLPFLKAEMAKEQGVIDIGAVTLSGEQHRLFEDNRTLYGGPVAMTVAKFDVRAPDGKALTAEGLRVATNIANREAFLDISASYNFESLSVAGQIIGPSHLDLALRHLDAKSFNELHRAYMKLASDPEFQQRADKAGPAAFESLAQPLMAILGKSPEFGIDSLEIDLPAGRINGKLAARLPGDKVGDLGAAAADPAVLMGVFAMMETDGEIAVPEGLLRSVLGEARAPMLDQLLQVGYLTRQGERLVAKFKYGVGRLELNDKLVDPSAFGRPSQAE